MNSIKTVKSALKDCGIGRVKVDGNRIILPRRVSSIELMNQLRRYGWSEDDLDVAYGGFSCYIKMSKDDVKIGISDFQNKVTVSVK